MRSSCFHPSGGRNPSGIKNVFSTVSIHDLFKEMKYKKTQPHHLFFSGTKKGLHPTSTPLHCPTQHPVGFERWKMSRNPTRSQQHGCFADRPGGIGDGRTPAVAKNSRTKHVKVVWAWKISILYLQRCLICSHTLLQ